MRRLAMCFNCALRYAHPRVGCACKSMLVLGLLGREGVLLSVQVPEQASRIHLSLVVCRQLGAGVAKPVRLPECILSSCINNHNE